MEGPAKEILFKMPTAERPQYTQKLLEILASPSNIIVKMTTYRKKWIPAKTYTAPESLEGKLAWVVCVDAKKIDKEYVAQRFMPIRQVRIAKALVDGDNLVLWLETQEYLSCDDYDKFAEELKDNLESLPPAEQSYIAFDVPTSALPSVKIVDSSEYSRVNEAWKKIVDSLGSMEVYRNAVFYRIVGVSKDSIYLETEKAGDKHKPKKYYRLKVNETYRLQIDYSLPDKQFELCPQEIRVSANEWMKIYNEFKIDDRVGSLSVAVKTLPTSDEYPYKQTTSLRVSLENRQLIAPLVSILVMFAREGFLGRFRRNFELIIWAIVLGGFFWCGTILSDAHAAVFGIPASTIGNGLSALTIMALPMVLAKLLRKGI